MQWYVYGHQVSIPSQTCKLRTLNENNDTDQMKLSVVSGVIFLFVSMVHNITTCSYLYYVHNYSLFGLLYFCLLFCSLRVSQT